jgi:hypothetical protein
VDKQRSRDKVVGDQLPLPWKVGDAQRELDRGLSVVPTRAAVKAAYGDWLREFPLSSFVTFTWSDEAAAGRYVYTDRAAVKDIERFLHRELVYPGQYFGVIEDHQHRNVPHAHVLMEDCVDWRFVHGLWKRSRGFFCSRPAESGAFYYVAKYVLKDGRCAERIFERLGWEGSG